MISGIKPYFEGLFSLLLGYFPYSKVLWTPFQGIRLLWTASVSRWLTKEPYSRVASSVLEDRAKECQN